MSRLAASLVLVLAWAGTARADDPPPHVAPFVGHDEFEYAVYSIRGAFGPARDTTIVVTFSMKGAGSFHGFALVPDAKAKHGQRKLALPKLPAGSLDGAMKTALVANLDKDADDELVIQLHVQRTVRGRDGGGYSYGAYAYVVLDWDGKKFVRLGALEKKIEKMMQEGTEMAEDEVRAALGVAKKK